MSLLTDPGRRRFLGAAAVTLATAPFALSDAVFAQSSGGKPGPGAHTSFAALKQIEAGVLNVGYAEAGPADGAVGDEFRTQSSRLRIESSLVEVGDTVEEAGAADKLVQGLAFLVLLRRPVRADRAERRDHGSADHAHVRDGGAQPADYFLHARLDRRNDRGVR